MSANTSPLVILKFGSSVLRTQHDLPFAVHEIHRHVRAGARVVAVTSAFAGRTDSLLLEAKSYGDDVSDEAIAAFVALGEAESTALLALALERAGIRSTQLGASTLGVRVDGASLDARVSSVCELALRAGLDRADVVVVPGFVGADALGRVGLLGRGGSDLTAVLLADALAARCVLVKDVDGLHEPGDRSRRFRSITYRDAIAVGARAFQATALEVARTRGIVVDVRRGLDDGGTRVGAEETRLSPCVARNPVRVALLGLGVVGRGVYERIRALDDRFELVGAAVRDVERHVATGIDRGWLSTDARAIARSADLVIELIGGIEPARAIAAETLRAGRAFITANKTLVARHGACLGAIAEASGATFRFGASVGGVAPCIELVERVARRERIVALEGVVNGTTNFVLDLVREGAPFHAAVVEAQRRGYAERDPSADLDGVDAADKLRILCRSAFGREPDSLRACGIRDAARRDGCVRLVARATLRDHRIEASVGPEPLPPSHALASVRGSWNRIVVRTESGATHVAEGRGAGRWPTAEAVIADALDAARTLRSSAEVGEVVAEVVA
ncbi:MAG: homoserine dehydrogenase [Phycisphaerales bacterium]